eukprot:2702434-Prymnesium_polylepis.1
MSTTTVPGVGRPDRVHTLSSVDQLEPAPGGVDRCLLGCRAIGSARAGQLGAVARAHPGGRSQCAALRRLLP